jgi:hypothetical protein
VKFSYNEDIRRQTLPVIESLTELKDIAFELFDGSLPSDFLLAFSDENHSFLLDSEKAFKEADRLSQPNTCVVNRLVYYTLRITIFSKDSDELPSPHPTFNSLHNSPKREENYSQENKRLSDGEGEGECVQESAFQIHESEDSIQQESMESVERESLDNLFHVEKALDVNYDDPDDVDDYEHDGFMSDQNGFLVDDPNEESDKDEDDINTLTNTQTAVSQNTLTTTAIGTTTVGIVFSALKTALLAPTFFCSSCSSSSETKENQTAK